MSIIRSRGVHTPMPEQPTWPRPVVIDRYAELLPLFRVERARRDAWLVDETAGWRYEPASLGVGV